MTEAVLTGTRSKNSLLSIIYYVVNLLILPYLIASIDFESHSKPKHLCHDKLSMALVNTVSQGLDSIKLIPFLLQVSAIHFPYAILISAL